MNILERGKAFVESLRALAARTAWDWKQHLACGSTLTIKNGGKRSDGGGKRSGGGALATSL